MSTREQPWICVIGLGHFGASMAIALSRHAQVLAIDRDQSRVNAVAQTTVQRALCLDAGDRTALHSAISKDFDEAVVSIGDSLEASILCTLHLKHLGIPVRAKAKNADHAEILRAVGASEVVFPEQETAERLVRKMLNPNLLDYIPLAKDFRVCQITAPERFFGCSLLQLELRKRYGLFVIAINRDDNVVFMPSSEQIVTAGDTLVMIGRDAAFNAFHRS